MEARLKSIENTKDTYRIYAISSSQRSLLYAEIADFRRGYRAMKMSLSCHIEDVTKVNVFSNLDKRFFNRRKSVNDALNNYANSIPRRRNDVTFFLILF